MQNRSFVAGLIGRGISQSRSPALHEDEGEALGLHYVYKIIDFEALGLSESDLAATLVHARRLGFSGLNVTHPYKQTVMPLLDGLSPEAEAIGAVNTVRIRDGRMTGHNTDAFGFAEGFRNGLTGAPVHHVVQLGAGGAGAATAYAMLDLGAERLELSDIEPARAAALAERLGRHFEPSRIAVVRDLEASLTEADGVVHATPTGMAGHPGLPLPAAMLSVRHWVAEIVYFPLETELLALARRLGCRTLDGGAMVVYQAAKAFELITGETANAGRMLARFRASIS
jgi:shikimate dehydrogenase